MLFFFQHPVYPADHKHRDHHQRDRDRECDPGGLDKACDDVGDKGYHRSHDRIRKLGRHMVYMLTLGTGRRHDRRVRDRGTVIPADSSCHAGGDGDDHEVRVAVLKYRNNDRDQDVPVANARKQPTTKIIAGRKFKKERALDATTVAT